MVFSIYIEDKYKKWDIIYLLYMDKIIELKNFIDKLYFNQKYKNFKYFSRTDNKYDRELESISKLINISIEKIYFYNNIIGYLIQSRSFVIENNDKLIHVTQFLSEYKDQLTRLMINVDFYKNSKMLFSATTFFGYIGILSAKNSTLSATINFEKYNIKDFIYYNTDPGLCLREIFENDLNYIQCKDILDTVVLKYPCYIVLTDKQLKYKIIYKHCNKVKDFNNIYHIGTDTSFVVKACEQTQSDLEKEILELLQHQLYQLYNYSKFEELLFGKAIENFVNNNLQRFLNRYPMLNSDTLYFYTCSITDDFIHIYCPK